MAHRATSLVHTRWKISFFLASTQLNQVYVRSDWATKMIIHFLTFVFSLGKSHYVDYFSYVSQVYANNVFLFLTKPKTWCHLQICSCCMFFVFCVSLFINTKQCSPNIERQMSNARQFVTFRTVFLFLPMSVLSSPFVCVIKISNKSFFAP